MKLEEVPYLLYKGVNGSFYRLASLKTLVDYIEEFYILIYAITKCLARAARPLSRAQ